MNNKRSDGACNNPVSGPTTDAYRDNWDKIFKKAVYKRENDAKEASWEADLKKCKDDCPN